MRKLFILALFILTLVGCSADGNTIEARHVAVSFDYKSQSGHASNQFAVWIEDANGSLVRTLYATKFTARGGYKNRPDSIKNWVAKSGLAEMPANEVDALTGATPKTGNLTYVWDLTDSNGNAVPDGTYKIVVEASLRWKNYVLFSGEIAVGGESAVINATPEYNFEADGNNAALTMESDEANIITNVTVEYVPN